MAEVKPVGVVYVGAFDAVSVPSLRVTAERNGDPVEVPADVAAGLVDRGDWQLAAAPKLAAKSAEKE